VRFSSLLRWFFRSHTTEGFAGNWSLVRVEVPHPIKRYELSLTQDGSCRYESVVSFQQGELAVSGSGRWWADGARIHFKLGEHPDVALARLDGEELVLDRIPGVIVAEGTPCTFRRGGRKS
jgi:hypothetical protein